MKKIFLGLMACAALSACTKDDAGSGSGIGGGSDQLDGNVAYLTVKINDVGSPSTRATNDGFGAATEGEYAVANAYFYFYDDSGNYMAKGRASDISGSTSSTTGIDYESGTIVAVWGLQGTTLPTRMVTVLNQPSGFDGTNLSLSEMEAALANATYECRDGSGNFVMSTSCYIDNGSVMNYTALTADNFSLEPVDLTTDYPNGGVDVYVERLAAKVAVAVNSNGLLDGANGNTRSILTTTSSDGYSVYDFSDVVTKNEFARDPDATLGTLGLEIIGWDVNGVARNSNMIKNMEGYSAWNYLTFVYNDASNYRSYWGKSYNYGQAVEYPTSSGGNTDATEETNPLNTYLKYTSLSSPKSFGGYAYCAENTNTVGVLDTYDNARTSFLIKARVGEYTEGGGFTPLDLIKYHGMYLTLDDFVSDMVDEVMGYDFQTISQEVVEALEQQLTDSDYSTYIEELAAAMEPAVYINTSSEGYVPFDGRFISLISKNDGRVSMWFNTTTATYTDGTVPGGSIPSNYYNENSKVVYTGEDLDSYNLFFKVDVDKLSPAIRVALQTLLGIINSDGYMPLDNSITITTVAGHTYTLRNYLIRAIETEAAAIDDDWAGSGYPIFYNQGLMYYSAPIEHLGVAGTDGTLVEGQYGVVRNHWYDYTLDYISDFGHGIADEDEVIVPSPETDYYYLGATVNILSWHRITGSLGF